MNNQEKNSYVRKQLLRALLDMMEDHDLHAIPVSDLTRRAEVGRASFYRNYANKEDVLRQEAWRLARVWKQEFDGQEHTAPNEILISLLDFYKDHSDFYLALYRAGLSEIVLETILQQTEINAEQPNAVAYVKSAVAYLIYGWVIEWFRRGMPESGTELARMMEQAQQNGGQQSVSGTAGGARTVEPGRIVVITGSPGTGKTTVSSAAANESDWKRSVHMHTDDFYHYLCRGAIPPHLPRSQAQNETVMEALTAAAKEYARGGYEVIVDGIVGPWFLGPWLAAVREGYEIHYIILRAGREETLQRALGRDKLDQETNLELVEAMWGQFQDLGPYERHVIDTARLSLRETVSAVRNGISCGTFRLTVSQ